MKNIKLATTSKTSGKQRLLSASREEKQDLLLQYQNNEMTGYNQEQIEQSMDEYGKNIITHKDNQTFAKKLFEAFINPFSAILFLLSIVMIVTDAIIPAAQGKVEDIDPFGFSIIIIMVSLSGVLRFLQETRSSKAAERLQAMIKTTTCVLREGQRIEVEIEEVVVGDIVCLSAGDMIPADVRILSSKDLFLGESSLTGESNPVEKTSSPQNFDHTNSLILPNLAFMGTSVISGHAVALVIAVGDQTHFGDVAKTLVAKRPKTSFDKGVNSISWLLIRFMSIMVPIVFVINGLTGGIIMGKGGEAWVESLMFGLAVAVGLTPEMLPMIVTAGLAKGAVKMSKQKTIVKSLNSIQNFGAMDILCTDKTGTLTKDEIELEKYLDINGKEDLRILRKAFLNSYYQTGLKNVMDKAILKHSQDKGMPELAHNYIKVDEIPFDFARRRMTVVIKNTQGKTQMITKGAVEEMLSVCTYAELDGKEPIKITDKIKLDIIDRVEKLSEQGFRVLAVAQKNNPTVEGLFSIKDEVDMVLIGYLAFLDPPKESAKSAIKALKEHGVAVKILTGDSLAITRCIAGQVGLVNDQFLLGQDITLMDDDELEKACQNTTIFAKLTPQQKVRIVRILQNNGHVVGFMGDGINDAAALRQADVGISVDTAVDISKESADIILLEKDLMVLQKGVVEGRKTFANIIKYIKMTASSNFGNMFAVLVGSALIPFLPMIPLQILALNLIYDIVCISLPWDNTESEYIKKPRKWEAKSIGKFMIWMGPTSSLFDITTFIVMLFYFCPKYLGLPFGLQYAIWGSGYSDIAITHSPQIQAQFVMMFQTAWFVMSLWTQTLVIHMIRSRHLPFGKNRASFLVVLFTFAGIVLGTLIPYIPGVNSVLDMTPLPSEFYLWLALTVIAYMTLVTIFKKIFVKRYGELL
ncbi:MAG: magnesium-translocating P-type ATPase [Rickettsiales bacterium]|jgi:Mg2+-importing ATPase|nr:magnesium-translocating P-type ATPase [Rickettsiales bacterium]